MRLKYKAANVAINSVLRLLKRMSATQRQRLAHGIAWLIFSTCGKTRKRALNNIRRALPDFNRTEQRQLGFTSYKNIVHGVVECFTLNQLEFDFIIDEDTRALLAQPAGASIATMHMGCYEAIPFAMQLLTGRSTTISKIPPFVKNANKVYQDAGIDCVDKNQQGAFIHLLKAVSQNRVVSVHSDHFATDTQLRFFGQETGAPTGAAMLSAYGKVPLLLGYTVRSDNGRYQIFVETVSKDPIGNSKSELSDAMEKVYARFENIILQHAEQWYWSYNRWR